MHKTLFAALIASTMSLSAQAALVANFTLDGTTQDAVSGISASTYYAAGNTTTEFVTDRHGQTEGAMRFRDTTLLFEQPNAPTLTQFTFSAWLLFDEDAREQSRNYLFDSRPHGSALLAYDFGNYNGLIGTSNEVRAQHLHLDDGQWHHIVFSTDLDGTSLYVDGQMAGTTELAPQLSLQGIRLGNYRVGSPTYDFRGAMDDIQVHDTAMDAQRISEQYFLQSQPSDVSAPLWGVSILMLSGLALSRRKPKQA